jgi:HK97 family phage major capsid protein
MAKSHELRKQAEEKYRHIKDLYAKETLTAEDSKKFDEWNTEFDSLMAQAKKFEDFEKKQIEENEENREIEKNLKKGDLSPEQRKEYENLALKEFVMTGSVSRDLQNYMSPAKKEKDDDSMIDAEYRRLGLVRANVQSTTDGKGGYTIATGFQRELEKGMLDYGGMLEVSRLWKTAKGNTTEWPLVDDTMNRAYLLSEAANAETSAEDVDFTQQQFEAYKITSGMLRLNSELIEDSEFDIVGEMRDFLSERMGRGINYYATLADGSSKPKGITVAAAHGNNTENDTALSATDFVNLEHEVGSAYRKRARWMFSDSVLKECKRISVTATTVNPLWLPSFRDGAPSTILGYQYTINDDMASFTYNASSANDNAKVVLFGDFKKYIIRTVNNMRLVRLNERFGDTDQVAIVAFWRIDSDLLEAGKHPVKYMRVSAT